MLLATQCSSAKTAYDLVVLMRAQCLLYEVTCLFRSYNDHNFFQRSSSEELDSN
jgi:hypothetical protein